MMLELGVDVKANKSIGDEVCDEFNGFVDILLGFDEVLTSTWCPCSATLWHRLLQRKRQSLCDR